jgi:isopentenyl diphosphate isomerase/L-lactate dehydrogenase-like FMN-dependent dehydrogenase
MSSTPEEKAARIATALNGLGHIAMGHSLDEVRRSRGDAQLREGFHEDAVIILEMVEHEERVGSTVMARPADCKAALVRFRDMVRTIDFDDAANMARLEEHARQALEAFLGAPLSE